MTAKNSFGRYDTIVIFLLLIIAVVSRFYGLGEWHLAVDECFTFYGAEERYIRFLNPAYYALVVGMFKLFGINELTARIPAFIIGVVSIPVFYITWRNIVGRSAAVIGATFIIFSSWHLWHSQFARFYSGVFLFGSLSYYFFYRALEKDSLRLLIYALISMIIGILFHATSVMVCIACWIYAAVIWLMRKNMDISNLSKRIAGIFLLIGIAIGLIASPLFLKIFFEWQHSGQIWGYGPANLIMQIVKYMQIPVFGAGIFGALLFLHDDKLKGMYFIISICVPALIIITISPLMSVRPDYIFYTLPMIFLLVGLFCDHIKTLLHDKRILSLSVTAILIMSMAPEFVSHYTAKESLDLREAVDVVQGSYQHGDRVMNFLVCFDHYAEFEYEKVPRAGFPFDNSLDWQASLQPYLKPDKRFWFVLPMMRRPLATGLENWLTQNGSLVWRAAAKRYDYTYEGYQVFLVENKTCEEKIGSSD